MNVVHQIVDEENEQERQLRLLKRTLRDNSNPLEFPNRVFIGEFRLNKYLVRYLIDELQNVFPAERRDAIPIEINVFAALSFYASGMYQRTAGSLFYLSMSQSSMSQIIHEITDAIYRHLVDRWIVFPSNNMEKEELQRHFFLSSGVRNIIGCVDGTLINILAPAEGEHMYIDRKGNYSKNVQVVCDYNLQILSINARYPGRCHDAFVWRHSRVHEEMREHYMQGSPYMLLGDSGYPTQPWLLTPIRNAAPGTPQYEYTMWHSKARSCVERCIGKLKQRFRCIGEDNNMRYEPEFLGRIITVLACLHNMCSLEGLEVINNAANEDNNILNEDDEFEDREDNEYNDLQEGLLKRNEIINRYFVH